MGRQILGVDVGDYGVRAVLVNDQGAVLRRAAYDGADAGRAATELFDGQTTAVGISRDPDAENLVAIGFGAESEREGHPALMTPPTLCEPGTAAVIAEVWVGAARGADNAICLEIGDRVTAGILLDGRPWLGAHGRAGAAAWLALNPVERQDYRKFGSLAAEVSSKGIARRLSWRIQAGDQSAVLERAGDLDSITAAHVFEGARTGDGVSISVIRDTAKYIGMAIANLIVSIDPDVIVISGAAAAAGDLMLEPVRQECLRRLPPGLGDQVRIEMSTLGEEGVAIGAARLALLATA
jgi:glucokinase